MSNKNHHFHKPDHDWRFWLGLILIFGSMFIYLITEDLSLRPRVQSPPPPPAGVEGK
jgi:hypothetical protein